MTEREPDKHPTTAADQAFTRLTAQYMDEAPGLSAVGATRLGDHRFDAQLDEVGPEARARKLDFQRAYLRRLQAVPAQELSRENQVDAAILAHHLSAGLWRLEELQEWAWNPVGCAGLAGDSIYSLMARPFAPLQERLLHAACRLEQFPRLMEQFRKTLDPARTPKVHAETAIKQNRGIHRLIDQMIRPQVEELPASDRRRSVRAMAVARAAIKEHQRWLEEKLLPAAQGDFRIGAALFDRKLGFTLSSPLTRKQIRRMAEHELRRVRNEMYEIAAGVSDARAPASPSPEEQQTVIEQGLEQASRETPDPERIVEQATEMLAQATAFVTDAGLVSMPAEPCDVIVMPEFRRGVSLAYCDSPGPLEKGQRTFYAIAPPPADWTDEQVRSILREYNLRSLRNLTVHEAMPGHFLQLCHSNRHPSTVRATLSSGTFIEGWAVYAEQLMVEQGFGGDDPLNRLVVLKWYLRGIGNALLDQAVHVDGMNEADAMTLMTKATFQEEREAAGKWTRAQLSSTQLSTYFVGYQEHIALRPEIEAAWGSAFSLRMYHDTLLSFGSPPTQHVRALMLNAPIGKGMLGGRLPPGDGQG